MAFTCPEKVAAQRVTQKCLDIPVLSSDDLLQDFNVI